MTFGPLTFEDFVQGAFAEGVGFWGASFWLSPPLAWEGDPSDSSAPLAYIDLSNRQVVVHYPKLHQYGALGSLRAVFAHEVGHHVRFPHTLGQAAAFEVLQRRLIDWPGSLTNVFYDLLVNEWVGRRWSDELAAVFRGSTAAQTKAASPFYTFYLSVYEELWGLPPGDIAGGAGTEALEVTHPGARVEARVFAQTLYALPDVSLQFVYFISVFARYLDDPEGARVPLGGDAPAPDAEDLAAALRGSPASDRALAEARARGWLAGAGPGDARDLGTKDPVHLARSLVAGKPGDQVVPFFRVLVSRIYRDIVEQHLIEVPVAEDVQAPDPFLPSTTEEWEPGDSIHAIDWAASVTAYGALAPAMPLKRTLLADEPDARGSSAPPFEIYLDTSGSMPDPTSGLNAMTLAAQVLATAAIRKGARVRAVIYSSGPFRASDWMLDEAVAREALLYYSGGGTDFPFDELVRSAETEASAIRVIVSDGDFLHNVGGPEAMARLVAGCVRSRRVVALLALPYGGMASKAPQILASALAHARFRLVVVPDYQALAAAAADLGRALFS